MQRFATIYLLMDGRLSISFAHERRPGEDPPPEITVTNETIVNVSLDAPV